MEGPSPSLPKGGGGWTRYHPIPLLPGGGDFKNASTDVVSSLSKGYGKSNIVRE